MLPKKNRLPREVFEPVFKNGRRLTSPLFSFQYIAGVSGGSRFSAVVSKKVSKTAVGRNRIRRRVYTALGKILSRIKNPTHASFSAKPAVMNATVAETEREIIDLLQKASVLP